MLALLLACRQGDVGIIKVEPGEPDVIGVGEEEEDPWVQPSDEPSDEMTDMTIGYGEIYFTQIACPACVGVYDEFDISATLKLHMPTSGDYNEWMTPIGTCTTNLYTSHVSVQPIQSSQNAYFNDIVLNPVTQGEWNNTNMLEYQYQRNTSYNITSEHGTIQNAFRTIEGFDSIEPYTMLWVDPSYAFEAVISKQGTYLSWSPAVNGAQFEVLIAVYSPDGASLLGAVSCMENDVGYMNIPGTYFQGFPYWSLVAIHMIRHKVDAVPAPEFNGYFQSHMIWEVIGTGHIE